MLRINLRSKSRHHTYDTGSPYLNAKACTCTSLTLQATALRNHCVHAIVHCIRQNIILIEFSVNAKDRTQTADHDLCGIWCLIIRIFVMKSAFKYSTSKDIN